MSALYGTVIGRRGPGASRLADRELTVAARSWEGSVTIRMSKANKDAAPIVIIEVGEGSRIGGREVWRGPLASLMLQGLLAPQADERAGQYLDGPVDRR